ncbi:hypothetical protein BYT27DRAFT_7248344 [Phlegmacium glaucopus]|nr:hypothetical protein BYT27DRAFT_7248344 [Phlegmacium glaucopus]
MNEDTASENTSEEDLSIKSKSKSKKRKTHLIVLDDSGDDSDNNLNKLPAVENRPASCRQPPSTLQLDDEERTLNNLLEENDNNDNANDIYMQVEDEEDDGNPVSLDDCGSDSGSIDAHQEGEEVELEKRGPTSSSSALRVKNSNDVIKPRSHSQKAESRSRVGNKITESDFTPDSEAFPAANVATHNDFIMTVIQEAAKIYGGSIEPKLTSVLSRVIKDEEILGKLTTFVWYGKTALLNIIATKVHNIVGGHYQVPGRLPDDEVVQCVKWLLDGSKFMYCEVDVEIENTLKEWGSSVKTTISFSDDNCRTRYYWHLGTWKNLQSKCTIIYTQELQESMFGKIMKQSGTNPIHLLEDEDAEANGCQDLQEVDFENLDKAAMEENMEDWL